MANNAPFFRLALRTSHLIHLFRDAGLSFQHHDDRLLHSGCVLLDDLEQILNDINGEGLRPSTYLQRLEQFAHNCLSLDHAWNTTPELRNQARLALGLPAVEPTEYQAEQGRQ